MPVRVRPESVVNKKGLKKYFLRIVFLYPWFICKINLIFFFVNLNICLKILGTFNILKKNSILVQKELNYYNKNIMSFSNKEIKKNKIITNNGV